jgi:hypothetical protein
MDSLTIRGMEGKGFSRIASSIRGEGRGDASESELISDEGEGESDGRVPWFRSARG